MEQLARQADQNIQGLGMARPGVTHHSGTLDGTSFYGRFAPPSVVTVIRGTIHRDVFNIYGPGVEAIAPHEPQENVALLQPPKVTGRLTGPVRLIKSVAEMWALSPAELASLLDY